MTLWARRVEVCDAINATGHNPDYLPHVTLPPTVRATHDPAEAAHDADLVVLAVPSQRLRENLVEWSPALPRDAVLMSLMKGIELGTTKRMSEVIADVTGAGSNRICVLSGPNLAAEIAVKQPSASVIAAEDEQLAMRAQKACHASYFRPYTNTDVIGTEFGGRHELYERNYFGSHESIRFETLLVADVTGASARYKGCAEQCMAEYNLDGWLAPDMVATDELRAIGRKVTT